MVSNAQNELSPAIELRELSHLYMRRRGLRKPVDTWRALDSIDLTVGHGEVHGLLGPNGAGKSTICKILATVLVPTAGTASILGHDVVREKDTIRPRISLVLGGERGLYTRLTARQNLLFWAALYRIPDREAGRAADELMERVGLGDRGKDRVETFSRGMKQRLHLARGLVSNPDVMLLDEPTTGMDPVATKDFRLLIEEIKTGRTIFLTTHDMVEAETLCDRVTLINHGKIIATESPKTLATWVSRFERVDADGVNDEISQKISALEGVGTVQRLPNNSLRIETVAEGASMSVLRLLIDNGHSAVRTSLPNLEEVYFYLYATER